MKNNSKKTNKQNTTRTRAQASGRRVSRRSKADRRRILFSKKHVKMETRRALYGTDHGSSYALARGTDLNRRFVAAFLALVFAISTMVIGLNFVTRAEDPAQTPQVQHNFAPFGEDGDDGTHNGGLVLNKYLSLQDNGKYTLTLSAYAKGKTKINVKQIPTDYILVVDQSGSMAYADMPTDYKPVATPEGGWKLSDFDGGKDTDGNSADKEYYYKDAEGYHRVYRKWGDLFELVPRNSMYVQEVIDRRGLGWFQREENEEQDFTSSYYYNPKYDPLINTLDPAVADDNTFYPVAITATGGTLTYYIKFKYTDKNGTVRTAKFYNGTNFDANNREASDAVLYYNGLSGGFGPGDRFAGFGYDRINNAVLYHVDNNDLIGAAGVLIGNTIQPKKPRDKYTFANIGSLTTGMYIQNPLFIRHVGYNALAYRDFNGVEHIISSTDYCDKQGNPTSDDHGTTPFRFVETLHEAQGTKESRLEATKNALTAFVENVASQKNVGVDGTESPVDHRIAIVGFSSPGYSNDELMTNEGWTASNNNGIASPSTEQYQKALISARSDDDNQRVNEGLTAAIQNLTARGGTQPENGLNMAYSILNNSTKKNEYSNKTRNIVVVFFTDGRPGQNSESNQYTEANEVVASAWNIKRDYSNTQIYTVGVFGEADGNPLTYYEDLTNWWGASTTRVFLEKQRLEEDRIAAGAANNASVSPRLSNYRDYIEYAEKTYYADFYKEEGTIEPTTFTYSWTTGSLWWQESHSVPVTGYVHTISGTFWREAIRNAQGYPKQQNDTIADYMTVVSSSYPNATSFDGYWLDNTNRVYNTVVNGARGAADSKNYYKSASDPQVLSNIFTEIAEEASYAGTEVTIGTNAELRDTISDYFKITDDTQPYYEIFEGSLDSLQQAVPTFSTTSVDGQHQLTTDGSNPQFDKATKTVNLSGFDYTTNYIGYGKKVDGQPDNTGYMLRVTIPNLELNDVTSAIKDGNSQKYTEFPNEGSLYSNGNGAGIYQENADDPTVTDTIATFTSPYISRHSYTVKADSGSTASATFTIVDENGQQIAASDLTDVVIQKGNSRVPYSANALQNIEGTSEGYTVYIENLPAGAKVQSVVTYSADAGYDATLSVKQDETDVSATTGTTYITPYADGDVLIEVTAEANERPAVITMKTQGVQGAEGQPTPPDYSDSTKQFPIKITIGSDTSDVSTTLTRQTASGATTESIILKYDTAAGGYSKYVDSHGETHDLSLADGEKVELSTRVGNELGVVETGSAEYNTTVNNDSGLSGSITVQNSSDANNNKLAIVNTLKENPVITGITDSDNHNWIIYILAALGGLAAIGAGIFLWKKKDEFVEQ